MERRGEFAAASLQTESYLEREHNARWTVLGVGCPKTPALPRSQVTDSMCPEFPVLDAHKEYFLAGFHGGADYDLAAIRPLWFARYDCGWRLELRSSLRADSRTFDSQDSRRLKC